MSTIISRPIFICVLIVTLLSISACRDEEVPHHSYSKLRKGHSTLQLDAQRDGSGDLMVSLTSIVDLPFVDLRTKSGEQWIELARFTNLRAGETQSMKLTGPYSDSQYIWATSSGGDHRWAAQTGIVTIENSSLSSLSVKVLEFSLKLKPELSGKKVME
jgi:hypothetical protein